MGRPRHPIARATLLGIARRVFSKGGYSGTSTAEVAARAGLSKASLFHHFPTKEELYQAALQIPVMDLAHLIEEARLHQGSFAERLDRLSRLVVRYLDAHPEAATLLLREMLDRGPFMAQGGDAIVLEVLENISAFLEAGMAAGAFARQDPRQLTLSIVGLHLFFFAAKDLGIGFFGSAPAVALTGREEAVLLQVRRLSGAHRGDVGRTGKETTRS